MRNFATMMRHPYIIFFIDIQSVSVFGLLHPNIQRTISSQTVNLILWNISQKATFLCDLQPSVEAKILTDHLSGKTLISPSYLQYLRGLIRLQ